MTPPGLKPCTAAPPGRTVVVDGWCAEAADAVLAASPSSEPAAMTIVARGMLQRLNIGLLRPGRNVGMPGSKIAQTRLEFGQSTYLSFLRSHHTSGQVGLICHVR